MRGYDSNSYLLIKKGPEHGQRDVQDENPQCYFDLSYEEFLQQIGNEELLERNILLQSKKSKTYVIFFLCPVHPVLPLWILFAFVSVPVFNCKLKLERKWLLEVSGSYVNIKTGKRLTPMHLDTLSMIFPSGLVL